MSWDGTVSAVVVQLRSTVTFLTGALAWVTLFTSFLATPVSADQSTASGEIFIHTRVAAIVEIFGDDTDLIWVSDGLSDASNSTLLSGEAEARAKFTVRANQDYFLAVTVPNVWQPSNVLAGDRANHKFVRFDGAATGDYIGGLLFLDEDVGVLQSGSGGTTMWDLSTGRLVTQHYGAETREWGLGAIFDPSVVGNRQSPDGVASMIAQPDTYSTTATITAATVP